MTWLLLISFAVYYTEIRHFLNTTEMLSDMYVLVSQVRKKANELTLKGGLDLTSQQDVLSEDKQQEIYISCFNLYRLQREF